MLDAVANPTRGIPATRHVQLRTPPARARRRRLPAHDVAGLVALVRAMHRAAAMSTPLPRDPSEIVASLALLSSTIVVAVLLIGLLEERLLAALRRRVATISRQAQRRRMVGVLGPVRTEPPASARVA